jgi:polyhydroxyalkanoate synthesis regulator phasin
MFKDTAARVGTSRSAPSNKFIGGFALEPRDPNRKLTDLVDQKQVAGVIAVLDQYTHPKGNKEKSVDLPHAIFNAFHELGHGIERMSSDPIGERTKSFSGFPRITEGGVMADPSITANSLRSYLVQVMYAAADKKVKNPDKKQMQMDQQQAQSIVDELVNLQRKGVLDIRNDAGEVVDQARIRQVYEKLEAYRISDYAIRQHEVTYLHRPSELLADAISAYFIDPAGFKRQAPNAAAFVQKLLNSATSPTSSIVQFYSAPLAAVVATIMAMLAVGEREEEEEQAALSMGRGALSA